MSDSALYEKEKGQDLFDPDSENPKSRTLHTQPYDLIIRTLIDQIEDQTLHLQPKFQRRYVWPNKLASRLVESVLLNIPIPSCYLAQNYDFNLDVIDGQQRLRSIHRFVDNQFPLTSLEVRQDINGRRFHELPTRDRNKIFNHTLRCVVVTNDSDEEIKFDVFERLNSNTVPLNAQELRNCIYRGTLVDDLAALTEYEPWLHILRRSGPDKRMRDEELILRFFAFHCKGVESYRTPQKHWLNEMAKQDQVWSEEEFERVFEVWCEAIEKCLMVFAPEDCFRRPGREGRPTVVNRALMDLCMSAVAGRSKESVEAARDGFRRCYEDLFDDSEFADLITRAVDHRSRTIRRFQIWEESLVRRVFG